ncbi:MAG: hypothetical protein ACRD0H_13420 [Actinomycetes bacterium]
MTSETGWWALPPDDPHWHLLASHPQPGGEVRTRCGLVLADVLGVQAAAPVDAQSKCQPCWIASMTESIVRFGGPYSRPPL